MREKKETLWEKTVDCFWFVLGDYAWLVIFLVVCFGLGVLRAHFGHYVGLDSRMINVDSLLAKYFLYWISTTFWVGFGLIDLAILGSALMLAAVFVLGCLGAFSGGIGALLETSSTGGSVVGKHASMYTGGHSYHLDTRHNERVQTGQRVFNPTHFSR